MKEVVIIRGGKKGTPLNDLYRTEVILGGKRIRLLALRRVGPEYQAVNQYLKQQGLTGRFTLGIYDKDTADLLCSPANKIMIALQGTRLEVIGRYPDKNYSPDYKQILDKRQREGLITYTQRAKSFSYTTVIDKNRSRSLQIQAANRLIQADIEADLIRQIEPNIDLLVSTRVDSEGGTDLFSQLFAKDN